MADPFLDGKSMKLSKNGSDVICSLISLTVSVDVKHRVYLLETNFIIPPSL